MNIKHRIPLLAGLSVSTEHRINRKTVLEYEIAASPWAWFIWWDWG